MKVMSEKDLEKSQVTFDWATPQDWCNKASDLAGFNLSGHIVWAYFSGSMFGEPVALSQDVADKLVDM